MNMRHAASMTGHSPSAPTINPDAQQRIFGCLLGCAVGDSIGLPYEGLSRRRAIRFAKLPLEHRFVLGHGMVSDDTDHSIFVLQSLLVSKGDVAAFRKALAWRLRWWLITLPAGIGWATLRATVRMWFGIRNPGVYSAGNGPAMRSAIIGALLAHDDVTRTAIVKSSTALTHTDARACAAASAIAEVAARIVRGEWLSRPSPQEFVAVLRNVSPDEHWQHAVLDVLSACNAPTGQDAMAIAESHFGGKSGVSGFAMHSVPFALVAWYANFGNFRATIGAIVHAGGDVDTVAAIAGALAGAQVTESGIPKSWVDDIVDWPHSVGYLRRLASAASEQPSIAVPSPSFLALLLRGLLFTGLVLAHGLRRLLPPYG